MKITAASDVGNISTFEDLKRFVAPFLDQTKSAINGGISTDNLRCAVKSVTFTAANTQIQINHGLGVLPVGYLKLSGPNVNIFDGSIASTVSDIYLQASGTGTVTILVMG